MVSTKEDQENRIDTDVGSGKCDKDQVNLSPHQTMDKYAKMPLEIATLLFWFSLYTYPSIFSPYLKELKISTGAIGIILGSYGLSQVLFRIPIGIFSDKLRDRKSFIISGLVSSVVSALGLLIFKHPALIFISRMLAGVAASSWVVFSVLYSSYYKQSDSSKAISRIFIFQNTGTMSAMFIGGVVAEKFGWETSFITGGVAALAALLLAAFIKDDIKIKADGKKVSSVVFNEEKNKTSAITIKNLISVINHPTLLVVSFLAILMQFNNTATVIGFTPIYAESIGATKLQLGLLTFFSQLPGIFASIVGSKGVYTKIGERKTIVTAFFLTAVFSGIIPLIKTMEMMYLTQFLNGFFRGIIIPVLMGLGIKNIEPGKRATAMGAFQAIYAIGMIAGPAVFGFISQATEMWVGFLSAGIISLAGSIIALVALKE